MTDTTDDDKQIKVTDRRMFTADGELREEYRDLGKGSVERPGAGTPDATPTAPPSRPPEPGAAPGKESIVAPDGTRPAPTEGKAAGATKPETYPSGARFEELVALLAQTTATFLQQATRPDTRSESLEQAQLYFDLLEILKDRTAGNLSSREQAMLDDAIRQLRMGFAQHG